MREDDRKRIRKTFRDLVDNIHPPSVVDHLIAEGVLDEEDVEDVLAQTTTKGKTRKMLRLLMQKPSENVFDKFCKILRECEASYGYLADALELADISNMEDSQPDDVDSTSTVIEELRNQLMYQTQMIMNMKQDYQRNLFEISQMVSLRAQIDSTGHPRSNMQDVVDAGFQETHLREYVKEYCTSEFRQFSGIDAIRNGPLPNEDNTAFPNNIWGYIRSTITSAGGKRDSCSSTLSTEEIACQVGVDTISFIIQSRLQRSWTNMFISASTNSIMSSSISAHVSDSTVYTEASRIMKALVVSTLAERAAEFDEMIGLLDISELDGYTTFKSIADEMFGVSEEDQKDIKWGRVVAWYTLWAHFASNLPVDEHLGESVQVYGRYVGFYLARRLNTWMISANGWEGFVEHYKLSCSPGYGTLVWRFLTELVRQYSMRP